MLNLKKTAVAVLAFGSSAAFAGTMGPVCTPGNVTVPCENVAWEVGVSALYLKPSYNEGANHVSFATSGVSETYFQHDPDFDWGFKVEAAYHFGTGTDLSLNWSHLDNHDTTRLTGTLTVPGVDPVVVDQLYVLSPAWDSVNLELGQHVDMGEMVNVRFHGGVQYARIETDIKHHSTDVAGVEYSQKSFAKYRGFGPRVGADLSYGVGNGLSMYFNSAASVLVGESDYRAAAGNTAEGITLSKVANSDSLIVPELEAKVGLKYTYAMAQGELSLDGGWMWVDYINAQKFGPLAEVVPQNTDFALQGPYLGLKWVGAAYV